MPNLLQVALMCVTENYPIMRMHRLHAKKNVCKSCINSFVKMMGIVPVLLISIILLINQAAFRFMNFYPFLSKVTDFKVKFVDGRHNNHWK